MNDPTGQGPAGPGGPPPSEEEMQAAFEEQMRHIRVEDVVVQTTVTLVNRPKVVLLMFMSPLKNTGVFVKLNASPLISRL